MLWILFDNPLDNRLQLWVNKIKRTITMTAVIDDDDDDDVDGSTE